MTRRRGMGFPPCALLVIVLWLSSVVVFTACKREQAGWKPMDSGDSASGAQRSDVREIAVVTSDTLKAAGVSFVVPREFRAVPPSSPMRAAQFELADDDATSRGELAVFYFGPGQGGDAPSNVERWLGQFTTLDVEPTSATTERDGLRLTRVRAAGAFDPGMMAQGSDTGPRRGYALWGAILEGGPEGTLFLKATGPRNVIERNAEAMDRMLESSRRIQ